MLKMFQRGKSVKPPLLATERLDEVIKEQTLQRVAALLLLLHNSSPIGDPILDARKSKDFWKAIDTFKKLKISEVIETFKGQGDEALLSALVSLVSNTTDTEKETNPARLVHFILKANIGDRLTPNTANTKYCR